MKQKVLVVDDEQVIHDVIQDLLEYKGFEVFHAYDGQDGIQKVKEIYPNLLILDVNMPKISGFALSTLLSEDDTTRNIPIIFLTGFIDQHEAEQLDNQFSGQFLLTKPFEVSDLLNMVETVLKKEL